MTVIAARGLPAGATSCVSITLPFSNEPVDSELVAEEAAPAFNFSAECIVARDDASLTRLVTTPVVIRLLDADKAPLGECSLSLEPMLSASLMDEEWLPLGDADGPALLVSVSAGKPILTEDELEETTIFRSDILSMHRLPTTTLLDEGQAEADHLFTYTAVMKVAGIDKPFTYSGGAITVPPPAATKEEEPAPDPEAAKEGREVAAATKSLAVDGAGVKDVLVEEELTGQYISWAGASTTLFLGVDAYNRMRKAIEMGEPPATVYIQRQPKNVNAVLDTNAARYAAISALDLAPLMEVDTTFHAGRFAVRHHEEYEHVPPPTEPKAKKGPVPLPEEPSEADGAPHPYEAARTLLRVDVRTSYPLNPRPPTPPPPLPKTTDLIPKRTLPALAPKTAGAEFESQVEDIVESLAAEWSALFPHTKPDTADGEEAKDTRRRELLYQLNSSGQYFVFKEKLKRSVVRLAREVGKRPTGEAPDADTLQSFYNELYVALTKRMHAALDTTFFPPVEPPKAPSAPDSADGTPTATSLAALAAEAETLFQFDEAATYHQERVATSPQDPAGWLAYTTFLLRTGERAKAEECAREALALEPASVDAILAYGATLASRGSYEQAEIFLKAALDASPGDVQLWLLIGLLYERMERRRDTRIALKHAAGLVQHEEAGVQPYYMALARRLLPLGAAPLVTRSVELSAGVDAIGAAMVRAELLLQGGECQAAEVALADAAEAAPKPKRAPVLTLLGHAQLRQQKSEDARATYERALALCRDPLPVPLLLQLGALAHAAGDADRARYLFLHACRLEPSCSSWLGAGKACLALAKYVEAEECLCEANMRNNRQPAVWAQLALLCARCDRVSEAEQALEQTVRLDFADGHVLQQLGTALLECGRWRAAEDCFRRAALFTPSALTQKLLADAQLEQHAYKQALGSYKNALQVATAEEGAADVAAACTAQVKIVLAHLGRPEEAAAY